MRRSVGRKFVIRDSTQIRAATKLLVLLARETRSPTAGRGVAASAAQELSQTPITADAGNWYRVDAEIRGRKFVIRDSNADTSGDQTACLACKGNTVANGCTRSCSECGAGTIPNSDHSGCVPVAWSPHSKPFDLVWDSKHLDYNNLPLNPQWAFQLNPGGLPDFNSICGSAFSGGNSVNNGTLANFCTSQQTTFDIDHSLEEAGGYCQGLINGHLTWMKATYTGSVLWDSWSKIQISQIFGWTMETTTYSYGTTFPAKTATQI